MTPDHALAREAIRYTQAAYHAAGDRGRVDELVTHFTEDGVLDLPSGACEGRAAIADRLSVVDADRAGPPQGSTESGRPPGGRPFLHHHLTTSHLEFISDVEVSGRSYFTVMSPVGVDHCGRYDDTYVRVGDRWLIRHRRVLVSWASPDSVIGARAR